MDNPGSPFILALWNMVEDPNTDEIIHWNEDGLHFVICNEVMFTNTLLPSYYKHSNFSSFVRQLNMYGFHKLSGIVAGKINPVKKGNFEFVHQYFRKGNIDLLSKIKRKSHSSNKVVLKDADIKEDPQKYGEVYSEVKAVQNRLSEVENLLGVLQEENSFLWQELLLVRQRHQMLQQIVKKILQFLVALLQPSTINLKRNPIMINVSPRSLKKMKKDSSGPTIHELDHAGQPLDDAHTETGEVQVASPSTSEQNHGSSTSTDLKGTVVENDEFSNTFDLAPAIELLNELDLPKDNSVPKLELPEIFEESTSSRVPNVNEELVDPSSQEELLSSLLNGNYNNIYRSSTNGRNTASKPNSLSVAMCSNSTLKSKLKDTIDNIDKHLGVTQNELDDIKKIFNGCNSVDAKYLLQLFNEMPSYGLVHSDETLDSMANTNNIVNTSGTEVATYVDLPEVIDFNELLGSLDSSVDCNELPQTESYLNTPEITMSEPAFFVKNMKD